MGLFTSPEDVLVNALLAKQPQVTIEHCVGSLDNVFKNALRRERRLLAYISGYSANYMKKGLVQLSYDYDVTITYQDKLPDSIDDVCIDDGQWDPMNLLGKSGPMELTIVTSNLSSLRERFSSVGDILTSSYEGILGWEYKSLSFDKLSSDVLCKVSFSYVASQADIRQMQSKTMFATRNIWRTILGRSQVPQFVKPFLALSYIGQECIYDQRAYDEVAADNSKTPSDPVPHLAYGPLVERRGICAGFAWAFKRLMDEAKVECQCVSGYLKEDTQIGHVWCLVKLDGQYYHVDPTWGIKDGGVCLKGFLQPDSVMKNTHIWDTSKYPAAKGMRFNYEYIEDFLVENGADYLDLGAAEKYMFPDDIVE